MAGLNTADVAYKATDTHAIASQTDAAATATLSAPGAGLRYLITQFEVSASAAPAASVYVEVKNGATTIVGLRLPAAAIAPVVVTLKRPLVVDVNAACSIVCPALGAGVVGTVGIHAIKVAAQ